MTTGGFRSLKTRVWFPVMFMHQHSCTHLVNCTVLFTHCKSHFHSHTVNHVARLCTPQVLAHTHIHTRTHAKSTHTSSRGCTRKGAQALAFELTGNALHLFNHTSTHARYHENRRAPRPWPTTPQKMRCSSPVIWTEAPLSCTSCPKRLHVVTRHR